MQIKQCICISHSRNKIANFVNSRKRLILSTGLRKKTRVSSIIFREHLTNLRKVFYDSLTKFTFFCYLLTKFVLFLLFFHNSSIFHGPLRKSGMIVPDSLMKFATLHDPLTNFLASLFLTKYEHFFII